MGKVLLLSLLMFFMATKPVYTDKSEFISSQTEVLSVQWDGNALTVDVSKDITSYGGGNAMEYEVVSKILGQVFANPEVEFFTLLIEGEENALPEGTQILKYSRDDYENDYFCNTK